MCPIFHQGNDAFNLFWCLLILISVKNEPNIQISVLQYLVNIYLHPKTVIISWVDTVYSFHSSAVKQEGQRMHLSSLFAWNPAQPCYFFWALVFAFCVCDFCIRASVSLFSIFLRCFFFILLIFAVFLICETYGQGSHKTCLGHKYMSTLYVFPRIHSWTTFWSKAYIKIWLLWVNWSFNIVTGKQIYIRLIA